MALLALIPLIALQMLFCAGLGMILGVLNVFFRDVGQLFAICLQFWFWLTPIVYPSTILPEIIRPILYLNPMYPLINAYQTVLVSGAWPRWGSLVAPSLIGLALCIFALRLFRRRASEMVDEL